MTYICQFVQPWVVRADCHQVPLKCLLLRILIAPGEVDVALNVVGVMLDCRDIARLTVFRQQRGMTPVSEVFFLSYQPGRP